ncbi:MAG: hypothetical protein AAF826_12430 [Pseudomonadota bacterium]
MADCAYWVAFEGAGTPRYAHESMQPDIPLKEKVEKWSKKIARGELIDPETRPLAFKLSCRELKDGTIDRSAGEPIVGQNGYRLPHSFFQSYPMIAHEAIDVFHQFNLGEAQLFPVDFYKSDAVTPHNERVNLVVPGNPKHAYRELSENGENIVPYDEQGFEVAASVGYADSVKGKLFVTEAALKGPDIWYEPKYRNTYFISEALAQALIEAGIASDFNLQKVDVI